MTWEDAPIEVLGLSTRLNNVLRARGVVTLGKLMRLNRQELSYMPYLGPSAVAQILQERERFRQDPEGALRRRQEATPAREPKVTVITAETPLVSLNLPSRAKSALRLAKIRTVGQLCAMTREDLLGLDRTRAVLKEHGIAIIGAAAWAEAGRGVGRGSGRAAGGWVSRVRQNDGGGAMRTWRGKRNRLKCSG